MEKTFFYNGKISKCLHVLKKDEYSVHYNLGSEKNSWLINAQFNIAFLCKDMFPHENKLDVSRLILYS